MRWLSLLLFLLPAAARAGDMVWVPPHTQFVTGSSGVLALTRPAVDAINLRLKHCDAVETELDECQALPKAPPGFWKSTPGNTIKVGGITVVVGIAFVGGVAAGTRIQDAIRAGHL